MLVHNKPAMLSAVKNVGVFWAEVCVKQLAALNSWDSEAFSCRELVLNTLSWREAFRIQFRQTEVLLSADLRRSGAARSLMTMEKSNSFFFLPLWKHLCSHDVQFGVQCSSAFLTHSHYLGLELHCRGVYVRGYWRKIKCVVTVLRNWIQKPTQMIPVSMLVGRQIRTGGFS